MNSNSKQTTAHNDTPHSTPATRRPLLLLGLGACGKTTLGRALEATGRWTFEDLDQAIERREGMTVREIFAERGEAWFRRREMEVLAEISGRTSIIALGGGTPCIPGAMERLNAMGTTVWLQAPVSRLAQRVAGAPGQRPLLAGLEGAALEERIAQMLAQRTPCYAQAQRTFDSTHMDSMEQVAEAVARFEREFLGNQ